MVLVFSANIARDECNAQQRYPITSLDKPGPSACNLALADRWNINAECSGWIASSSCGRLHCQRMAPTSACAPLPRHRRLCRCLHPSLVSSSRMPRLLNAAASLCWPSVPGKVSCRITLARPNWGRKLSSNKLYGRLPGAFALHWLSGLSGTQT